MKYSKIYALFAFVTSFWRVAKLIQIIIALQSYRLFSKQKKWFYIVCNIPALNATSIAQNHHEGIGATALILL
jgi:hypothetical protein